MQPNLKKLKEDAFTDIAERSGITPRESTITTDKSGFVVQIILRTNHTVR